MKENRWRRGVAASATALATLLAGAAVLARPAAADGEARLAVCDWRACLALLPSTRDSDGDGVSDMDEKWFGTDPYDPASYPPPELVITALIDGKVPSFQRHFTELVVLPQRTPDGNAIATGLGEFQLKDRDSKLFLVFGDVLRALEINGFDSVEGSTISLPQKLTVEYRQTLVGPLAEMALVSSSTGGGVCCLNQYGANKDKAGGVATGGATREDGTRVPEFQFSATGVTRTYTVTYDDGSHDDVTAATSTDSSGQMTGIHSTSFDADGHKISSTYGEKTSWVEDDGTRHETSTITTNRYDKDGNKIGSTTVERRQTTSGGTTTTETKRTELDGNGKEIAVERETTETCSASKLGCTEGEKYVDPDYVAPGPLTAEDMERVKIRLNSVRKPGPDDGEIFYTPTSSEHPYRPDSWYVLINPDGVTVFAVAENPFWNTLQPDYDPWLTLLTGAGGAPTPKTDGDTVRYP